MAAAAAALLVAATASMPPEDPYGRPTAVVDALLWRFVAPLASRARILRVAQPS